MMQFVDLRTATRMAQSLGNPGLLTRDADNAKAEECIQHYRSDRATRNIMNQLHLRYQPQIDMRNGSIIGAEAQAHLIHPEFELSPHAMPAMSGDLSKETAVAEWAVREACLNLHAMSQAGSPVLRTTLRISAQQMINPRLPSCIREATAEAGIQPGMLDLGISESALLGSDRYVSSVLRKLADTGVGISIRDFGSAHSGLSYPINFPVNAIWIDCPFFWRFARGADAAEIISTILSLAEKMQLDVVAWGVECANQMMMLYDEGCSVMQGNLLCRPLQAKPFTALVNQIGAAQQPAMHNGCQTATV